MKSIRMFLAVALVTACLFVSAQPSHAGVVGTVDVNTNVTETVTQDLGASATWAGSLQWRKSIANGSGSEQANKVFQDSVTLAGSGAQSYDLDGALTGPLASVTFTRIHSIVIRRTNAYAASTQDENVKIHGDFILTKLLDAGGDTLSGVNIPIRPAGVYVYVSPDPTGTAITATTGDVLTLTNASSADSVTLEVLILGS